MTANVPALPKYAAHGIPRRCRIDLNHPAECAIRNALAEVERLGADVLLTQAVTILDLARERIADWLEGGTSSDMWEREAFVLAACRDAQDMASRYGWALHEISQGGGDAKAIARAALLGADASGVAPTDGGQR